MWADNGRILQVLTVFCRFLQVWVLTCFGCWQAFSVCRYCRFCRFWQVYVLANFDRFCQVWYIVNCIFRIIFCWEAKCQWLTAWLSWWIIEMIMHLKEKLGISDQSLSANVQPLIRSNHPIWPDPKLRLFRCVSISCIECVTLSVSQSLSQVQLASNWQNQTKWEKPK